MTKFQGVKTAFAIILVLVCAIGWVYFLSTADCEDLGVLPLKDTPSRCLMNR